MSRSLVSHSRRMQVKLGLEAVLIPKEGKENCSLGFFLVNLPHRVIERIK